MNVYQSFIDGLRGTTLLEYIGVFSGIICVWLGKKEHILNYPFGILNTGIYVYLSCAGNLLGEASVNIFYTVMNVYGWILWARKGADRRPALVITRSNRRDWIKALAFFGFCWLVLFVSLSYAKTYFAPRAIPLADGFSAAAAYTGMWLLTQKKIENWIWWIITDIASIPLYFIKGYVFTSFQFLVFLVLAIMGLVEWINKWKAAYA
ncbi:nicotinamide riboside transporter PnuC [Dinghuibacter silviterrae]|uniref:Nicotinamide riboside transporter PnuC n=1 Tax=Dinghuibacter silviterrae TaxID=1539049 RepID=A0A4R8DPD3_9BACT|nr:nicotinamide riboside transporter PnuC [Dinghuibacter silviterrae]TDW99585.1 nicotinamide mononucleotide transporter [Dinghuibacter silviterrae]